MTHRLGHLAALLLYAAWAALLALFGFPVLFAALEEAGR